MSFNLKTTKNRHRDSDKYYDEEIIDNKIAKVIPHSKKLRYKRVMEIDH